MELNSKETRLDNFTETAKKIQSHVDPGYGLERVKDIEIAITEFIKDVTALIAETTPQLKVSEIILFGGYQEGTKIYDADEFDFLVVMEELSKPGLFTIEKDEKSANNAGIVKLKLANEGDTNEKWKIYSDDGYLRCFEPLIFTHQRDSFGYRVIEAIPKLKQNKGRKSLRENDEIDFFRSSKEPELIYCQSRPIQHVAMIRRAVVKFPNVLLEFEFGGKSVSVDLCPAIRSTLVDQCFNPKNCFTKELADLVIDRKSILLVGQENCLFRVTYTETEVDFVKNRMKQGHKCLYILLKVIAHCFPDTWKPLPSYALKTMCIKHDLLCVTSKNQSLLKCFDELMDLFYKAMRAQSLTSVFDKRLDLFGKADKIHRCYREKVVAEVMPQIVQMLQEGLNKPIAEFLHEMKTVIDKADRAFDALYYYS